MPTEPRLEHQTVKVKQLVESYRAGQIVIPEFQREYVWRRSKAPRLIDSLYRRFPISSFLLWQSTEDTRARRRDPRLLRSALMSWLIDGQQRVITLARTMNGDEGIDVVFHPEQEEFRLANAATRKDRNWVRVAELWDDDLYRQLRRNLDGSRHADRREARFEAVRRILDYEIPVVSMIDHSFNDAVRAFTRINTLGVRLKKEDIESAQVAARHSGFVAAIANVVFIAGDVNKSIGQSGPEVYLKRLKPRVLKSQCIPTDSSLWTIDQAEAFWQARRELLAESFNEYVRAGLPHRRV